MATTLKRARWLAVGAVLFCGLIVGAADPAGASRTPVIPPAAHPHGATYAEWSARWWQWAFSTEATATGPFGQGEVDCGVNQPHRKVWFLAGPFNASGAVERTCTVPLGTMLLIPLINVECSNLEERPFFGGTPAERRRCVRSDAFTVGDLAVTVDGHEIDHLERFEVISPDFAFTGVRDNPVGVEGTGFSTSRGVYLMLTPLARGTHAVTFTGSFPSLGFTASANYTIVVAGP
jgi:hypothetical protein